MPYTVEDEQRSQSEYSPGIVKDKEDLLRTVFNPEHMRDGEVIETAIPLEDLKSRGFSVDRKQYAQKNILQQRIEYQMGRLPEKRQSGLIVRLQCGAVRNLHDENGERAFIVIDTALKENIAHASICSATDRGRGALRKLRSLLLPYLQTRYSLEEIFS